jgi:DNA replication initiation complex subunit (GINS family)
MNVSVTLLKQRILAIFQWRSNLIVKRDSSDGCDKSIDDLIADADAYIQSLQRRIASIKRSEKK